MVNKLSGSVIYKQENKVTSVGNCYIIKVKIFDEGNLFEFWVDNGLGHFFIFFDTLRHNLLERHFILILSWFRTIVPLAFLTETKVE